ncbi:RAD52 motif-containing protein 1 [Oryzias melastigma]|uniref:RAD52 motif-containing protein 1 n=1 Tax=Oryzias melastigma TaxID=30732 RepID=A0A834FIT5_ORYME|nr:RAD52 motif-containing protein 1 [Oryzias melastigma]
MDVDVLEFRVPVEKNKCLFVWDIQPNRSQAQIHVELHAVFSSFGPLYLLKVTPTARPQPPGFFALIKFYSAAHAAEAQRRTNGQPLLNSPALKVKLSSRHTLSLCGRAIPLSHSRCLDLANHYLGFNGWTSDIITLKELTDDDKEEEGPEGGTGCRTLRFGCVMRLSFPQHDLTTQGSAVVEDSFTCTGAADVLQRRCRLQRAVRERALVQAFSSVLLLLLGGGKLMVAVKQSPDWTQPEGSDGVLQVNEASLPRCPADEEEAEDEEWDLTVF